MDLLLSPWPFTELLLPISCLQCHDVRKVLGPAQTRRKIEAGIDVTLSNVDEPAIQRHSTLTSRTEGSLPILEYGLESAFGTLIDLPGLNYALFSKGAHCVRHFSIAKLLMGSNPAMCITYLRDGNSSLALHLNFLGNNLGGGLVTWTAHLFGGKFLRVDDFVMVLPLELRRGCPQPDIWRSPYDHVQALPTLSSLGF